MHVAAGSGREIRSVRLANCSDMRSAVLLANLTVLVATASASFSASFGITGYVGESVDVGPNNGDPNSWAAQQSFQWYSYDANTPAGTPHEAKNGAFTNGSNSC